MIDVRGKKWLVAAYLDESPTAGDKARTLGGSN
jgi:hypothetical protein